MKWYTNCNEQGLNLAGECLVAAVHSCLENSRLVPHLVYDGAENELTRYLTRLGVRVIHHSLSFKQQILDASPRESFNKEWALGTFLRFDIPLLEREDEVVLYTDIDVVFCGDVALRPFEGIVAAANEYVTDTAPPREGTRDFNAGVMMLKLPVLRRLHPTLVGFTVADDFSNEALGWYDQGVLNAFFREFRSPLPQELNWRPFARLSSEPTIIHFHLLKPSQVAALQQGLEPALPVTETERRLYANASAHYDGALETFRRYVPAEGRKALLAACPESPVSP